MEAKTNTRRCPPIHTIKNEANSRT
uniref:Uncharacterized protein n=1 Tax=Arundo donax TaxID=35708 RepID=A0A0A9CEK1_ARUDO